MLLTFIMDRGLTPASFKSISFIYDILYRYYTAELVYNDHHIEIMTLQGASAKIVPYIQLTRGNSGNRY